MDKKAKHLPSMVDELQWIKWRFEIAWAMLCIALAKELFDGE